MMGLIARAPSTLSSSASESPGKKSYESQSPCNAKAEKYDRTVKPVVDRDTCHEPGNEQSMLNEVDIDFRIPGLPHSVVKQAVNYCVRELVGKIENHPHRQCSSTRSTTERSLQPVKCDVQENDSGHGQCRAVCNCSRQTPRRSAKNGCHTGVKASSIAHAGFSWKKLWPIEVSSKKHWTFFQFQNMSLRRDDLMAIDMGKLHNKKNIIKSIIWKRDASRSVFKGIRDRFVNDPDFRASQPEHDRTEEVCIKMDELAEKNFSYHMTQAEYFRYKQNWWPSLNKSGNTGPLRNRSDFTNALSTLNHLHQESGGRQLRPVAFWKCQQWHQSSIFFVQLVAMEWFLVEFIIIQRKSINEVACKATW